ncbi:pentapeptide repeat-containing protein [Sulfitobacter sp. EE-36]|uniref:anti-phage Hailong system effector protein HalA n=1 Tax=Sulfitobacter TaxID=60136 RepID=UPI0000669CBF|nr:pentapeptide repeat-containing protein [Sulfitobacter sp. EE-36]EAP83416.1 hypothetical protein EE36_00355 [Sulfitobacter sp. EE-36]
MTKQKRTENWWEPVYSQEEYALTKDNLREFQEGITVEDKVFMRPEEVNNQLRNKLVTFKNCDFEDSLDETRYIFEQCTFSGCDFGGSVWKQSKFRGCRFDRTSFSISTFKDCEFRECEFSNIAFSGNTTVIPDTLITNPSQFIGAASIFEDQIPDDVSTSFQKAHLRVTQSTLSRIIMDNLSREGSEESYYEAVKCRTIMAARARYAPKFIQVYGERRKIKFASLMLSDIAKLSWIFGLRIGANLEVLVLRTLGSMNAWGASVSRSVLVGSLLVAFFALLQVNLNSDGWNGALMKTCEVFFLFGYTNHTSDLAMPGFGRFLFLSNAVVGLIWYAVFITTVINKLTRQRS